MLKRDAPAFASGLALDCLAKHSVDFWMPSEGLPDSENRVVLNKDGKICLHDTEHNLEGHRRLERKLKNMLGGIGCDIQAYMWASLAAGQGYELAAKGLKILEKEMTPAQLAEAQRLVREWKAKWV